MHSRLVLLALVALLVALPSATDASASCQCTQYVGNRFNLNWALSCPGCQYAKQLGPGLVSYYHWTKPSSPSVGDIVIFQPGTYKLTYPGGSGTATVDSDGHIGVISGVSGTTFAVTGANQGCSTTKSYPYSSKCVTADDCTNVNTGEWFERPNSGQVYYSPPKAASVEDAVADNTAYNNADNGTGPSLTIANYDNVTPNWVIPVVTALAVVALVGIVTSVVLIIILRKQHVTSQPTVYSEMVAK